MQVHVGEGINTQVKVVKATVNLEKGSINYYFYNCLFRIWNDDHKINLDSTLV